MSMIIFSVCCACVLAPNKRCIISTGSLCVYNFCCFFSSIFISVFLVYFSYFDKCIVITGASSYHYRMECKKVVALVHTHTHAHTLKHTLIYSEPIQDADKDLQDPIK